MSFKKNISDKLALGYGSKYQLLRMLGWHRNDFNNAIAIVAGIDSDINWLDFSFNGPEDKELLNFDFIPELKNEWRKYWACGVSGLNWDAVGKTHDGIYVLIEAKAHVGELKSSAGGKKQSKKNNNIVINSFLKKYHINKAAEDWNKDCYQLANRLIALDFLNSKGFKAKLVYVLFENRYEFNSSSNKSASRDEWLKAFNDELVLAGIKDTEVEKFVNVCVYNCNRGESSDKKSS